MTKEVVTGCKVKGGMVRAHLDWLQQTYSPAQIAAVTERLQPSTRAVLAGPILAGAWYELAMVIELDRAIVDVLFGGDPSALRALGAFSARRNLESVYRAFTRKNPHDFFENSALLHKQFQDFGSAEYNRTGESSGVMHHRNYACYSPLYCASALGFYEEALRLHGATAVRVVETECHCRGGRSCTFEMRWS